MNREKRVNDCCQTYHRAATLRRSRLLVAWVSETTKFAVGFTLGYHVPLIVLSYFGIV